MRQILLRNKGNFESVAMPTAEKFPAVNRQNLPCPTASTPWDAAPMRPTLRFAVLAGLWQKSLLAALKSLNDEPHRPALFALRINDFCQQRNTLQLANSA